MKAQTVGSLRDGNAFLYSGMAFVVPDRELWEQGYAAEAGRSLLDITLILDEGLAVATPFITPLRWEPKGGRWLG